MLVTSQTFVRMKPAGTRSSCDGFLRDGKHLTSSNMETPPSKKKETEKKQFELNFYFYIHGIWVKPFNN